MSPSTRHLREMPPRHVDVFTKMSVLFGGTFQFMGWFFLFLGSIFCWIFLSQSTVKYWFEGWREWTETEGTIFSSDRSNATENNTAVFKIVATYQAGGETHFANGFVNGQRYSGGETVTVKYDKANQEIGYIKGAKRAPFSGLVALVLVFPLVGIGFVVFSLRKNLRAVRLLVNGAFTRGTLKSKSMTATRVNNRPVQQYEFSFMAGGREHLAVCKTHQAELVEDEEKEIILYDVHWPAFNVVYDAEPFPRIDDNGQLVPAVRSGILRMLLPLLTILVNVLFFQFYFS